MKMLQKIVILLVAAVALSACDNLSVPEVLQKGQKAGLQVITSNEEPVSLFLNSVFIGKTPFIEKDLQPGSFSLNIQPDNPSLVPYETTVNLEPGALTVVTWKPENRPELSGGVILEMKKLENPEKIAEIAFETIPEGAIVALGNGQKEFSPVLLSQIEPGHHEFEISLPSYETQRHTINVMEGYRMTVKMKLAKLEPTQTSEIPSTPSPTATPITTPSTGPEATISARVKIIATGFFQDGQESLRVRSKPGATGETLGYIPVGTLVPFLEKNSDNWYKIIFEGKEGWVSGSYVEKP